MAISNLVYYVQAGNILLSETDRFDLLKIADFGFSTVKKNGNAPGNAFFKVCAGTLSYMAPEQAQKSEAFRDLNSEVVIQLIYGAWVS